MTFFKRKSIRNQKTDNYRLYFRKYSFILLKKQMERVKNPTSYMLTILYMAPEQFQLDLMNSGAIIIIKKREEK